MQLDIFEINAFAENDFSGNPAAICPLAQFLSNSIMQSIAAQNNLPETAFIVPDGNDYLIRWFAPNQEVQLCGHATLAAAYVVFHYLNRDLSEVSFKSISGLLTAKREGDYIELNFPARPIENVATPALIREASNLTPQGVLGSDDYIVLMKNEDEIRHLKVNLNKLLELDRRGVVFTAPGDKVDFVSRVFHAKLGIGEDPVCGSAHCQLMTYWSKKLNKTKLHAKQLSSRGGDLICEIKDGRVYLKGKAYVYLEGKIYLNHSNYRPLDAME
jgi:PhzF family phenazine biosynthesis protein